MLPDWKQARRRLGAQLDQLAATRAFRITIAALLACMHLALFAKAGHDRLDVPFNSSPDEAPYFSNPDAPGTRGYPRQPHHWSRLIVSRWDAQHYIGTAVRGLTACPETSDVPDLKYLDCGLGWLPAFGEAGGLVSRITGLAEDVSLLLIAILAAIAINLMWTSKTMVDRIGRLEAYAALIAFNAFPTSFYMVTPYSESTTLALVLGAFLCVAHERWVIAGLLVGAASALRIQAGAWAIALACAALFAAWQGKKKGTARWWWPLLAIPLSGWGQVVEMIVLKIFVGDFMAFWRARTAFGDPHEVWRLWSPTFFVEAFRAQHMDGVIFFGSLGIILLTAREVLKRFNPQEAVMLAAATVMTLVVAIIAPLHWWGIDRYLLLCPLIFLGSGSMVRRYKLLLLLWLVLCAMFYWHIEMCSYIAQGDPRVCPCTGYLEFLYPWKS